MPLEEHRGLFLKTLSSAYLGQLRLNGKFGVLPLILKRQTHSYKVILSCPDTVQQRCDREELQRLSPWVNFFVPFGESFPGSSPFSSCHKCSPNNKG